VVNSALLLCHGCGVHQLFFCQLSLLAVVTVIEREHVHADVRPSEAADAIVAELVAEAEAQRAAEKSTAQLRLRPRPQPRAQRRTAAPNDKVAAATAAAAAATAGIVTGSSHRAAPAAAAGAAPWEFNPEAQGEQHVKVTPSYFACLMLQDCLMLWWLVDHLTHSEIAVITHT